MGDRERLFKNSSMVKKNGVGASHCWFEIPKAVKKIKITFP